MEKDKDLARFLKGETNYYIGELSIGRESVAGKPTAYFIMKSGDIVLKEWWGKIGDKPKKEKAEMQGTGGKKPYVMVMSEKLLELQKKGEIRLESIGCLTILAPYIEWGTGKLVHKRTKKPLQAADISEILKISNSTWARRFKELKENKLMTANKGGYFISTELFKKGGSK